MMVDLDVRRTMQRVGALRDAERPQQALDELAPLLARDPDSVELNVLAGQCLVDLDEIDRAESAWRRATAAAPDDVDAVVLGVRCAWRRGDDEVWERAERLRDLAATAPIASYWVALAAARTGREAHAREAVARLTQAMPDGPLPLIAVGYVDFFLCARSRREPLELDAAVQALLARDPNDVAAHKLRLLGNELRQSRSLRPRALAARQLGYMQAATAAGYQPAPGQIQKLVVESMGLPALGLLLLLLTVAGHASIDGARLPALLALLPAAAVWFTAFVSLRRRTDHGVRRIPAAGRARLLRPVARSARTSAAALIGLGVCVLCAMAPFTAEQAGEFGFGAVPERTITTIEYIELPTITTPSIPGLPTGTRRPPVPQVTSPPTRIAVPRQIKVDGSTDLELATQLLSFWVGMAVLSIAGGLVLLWHARSLTTTDDELVSATRSGAPR